MFIKLISKALTEVRTVGCFLQDWKTLFNRRCSPLVAGRCFALASVFQTCKLLKVSLLNGSNLSFLLTVLHQAPHTITAELCFDSLCFDPEVHYSVKGQHTPGPSPDLVYLLVQSLPENQL